MKLTYEDKIQIYILRKQGRSFKELSKRFGVDVSGLKYMVRLIERYGIEIVKKGKNRYYSPELKEEIINKVLLKGRSRKKCIFRLCSTQSFSVEKLDSTIQEKWVYYC